MAIEVISIIDPDSGAGYDYDSLYDWEAAEQGDLTGARDEIAVAKCRCTGGTADTTAVSLSGWTTSATQYIKIWTDPAEGYRHDGKYVASGNVYRLVVTLNASGIIGFGAGAQFTRIDGLLIVSTDDTPSVHVILYDLAGGLRITNCVIHSTAATKTNPQAIFIGTGHTGAYSYIVNNIFYNHNYSIYCRADGTSGRAFIYNNTIYASATGIRCRGDGVTAKNNLVIGCTDCFLESTEFETATDNAYDEGSDPGSDGVDLSGYTDAQIFTDVATIDFSLAASSPAIGVGANLYNDATYPFQDDIIGTDRGGSGASWDIGAFEYVAAGGETYSETATDGFKSGEVLARISTFRNAITDGFSGGESTERRADLVSLSSDAAKIGEALARILSGSRSASDGVSIAEALARIASMPVSASDGFKVSDQSLARAVLSLTATDGATLSDQAARRLNLSATLSDSCKLSEVLATVLLLLAAVADGAKFSETITTDLTGILEEIINDGFRTGDSPSSLAQFIRAVADKFNLSETVAAILRAAIIAADGIKAGDSTSAVGTFARSASDAIVITDATAGDIITGIIQAIVADGFRFSETTATIANFQITVTDGAKFAETIATIISMMEAIADGLGLSDSASISTEAALASGRVTITFSMKGSRVVFTVTRPRVQFTLH